MVTWVKGCEATACVEVSFDYQQVAVRSSLLPSEVVYLSRPEWVEFINSVKRGVFDLVDVGEPD